MNCAVRQPFYVGLQFWAACRSSCTSDHCAEHTIYSLSTVT